MPSTNGFFNRLLRAVCDRVTIEGLNQRIAPGGAKPFRLVAMALADFTAEETETLGFLISTHPLTLYESRPRGLQYIQAKDMKENIGGNVTMVGWCITSRTVITTHDELMEFVSFEDTTAIFETNLFPQAFRRYAHLIDVNEPFVLRGRVTDDHGCVTLNVTHVDTRLFYEISKSEKRALHFG